MSTFLTFQLSPTVTMRVREGSKAAAHLAGATRTPGTPDPSPVSTDVDTTDEETVETEEVEDNGSEL